MRIRRFPIPLTALCAVAVLAGCAAAPTPSTTTVATPTAYAQVSMANCGVDVTFTAPPKAAVTLNQGATEVMLALGLESSMVGTAYLDDKVPARWADAYAKIKVLAEKYPSKESFLAAGPDFAYASYASAFTEKNIGTREELKTELVSTYLSPFGCPKGVTQAPGTLDAAWSEVTDVAKIFGVPERAATLVDAQKASFAKLKEQAAGKGKSVLWYDSGDKELFAGAGKGGPQIVLDTIGATNIFSGEDGGWATVSWEKVVAADPDVIVLADASWSTAASKIAYLEADPVLSKLKAVKAKAFVTVPFSESTPGIRLVDGATTVADQIAKH